MLVRPSAENTSSVSKAAACSRERLKQLQELARKLQLQLGALRTVGLETPAAVMAEALSEVTHLINYRDCPAHDIIRGPYTDERQQERLQVQPATAALYSGPAHRLHMADAAAAE